jgi:hypothetical protein
VILGERGHAIVAMGRLEDPQVEILSTVTTFSPCR